VGEYRASDWHEAATTLNTFAREFLSPSIARDHKQLLRGGKCSSHAHECEQRLEAGHEHAAMETACDLKVAYLAQHRLLEQIPSLLDDVQEPCLWSKGYEVVNVWMGTQGTVRSTPTAPCP
jgi:hypothetical protein